MVEKAFPKALAEAIEEHAKPILQNKELLYTEDMDRITSLEDFHKSSKGACMLYSIVRPGAATSCACTCIDYQRKETCDCSLAWDVKHGRIQIPEEKHIRVIGEETKRGGRRKARKGGGPKCPPFFKVSMQSTIL